MDPKRKSFSGAADVVAVVVVDDGVDLRFPRGKACSVMVYFWCVGLCGVNSLALIREHDSRVSSDVTGEREM